MSNPANLRRAAIVLVASLAAVSLAARPAEATPDLPITGGTASEHEIVQDAWHMILETFPGLRSCLSDPIPRIIIRPSNHVGIYDFRIDAIILRAGGFHLADIVHELAHHLDWECGFESEDEDGLFATTDLASHLRDSRWKYRPIEIFAEAVVKLILGPDASSAGGRVTGLHPDLEIQEYVARWGGVGIPTATRCFGGGFSLVPV
jgi:hypothetical protein